MHPSPRARFERDLAELRGTRSVARANMLADCLVDDAAAADAPLRRALHEILAARGMAPVTLPPASLRTGETWLLLHERPEGGRVVRIRARAGADDLGLHTARAVRGLLATTARACRELPRPCPPIGCEDLARDTALVEGASFELAAAVALLSAAVKKAPSVSVAGAAQVRDDGTLAPVDQMTGKLAALRATWPEVTRVVVAARQGELDAPGVEIVRAAHLSDALPAFGLDVADLPAATLEGYRVFVAACLEENTRARDADAWCDLAGRAWEAAQALAEDEPDQSARALLWASMFLLHGGDADAARACWKEPSSAVLAEFPDLLAMQRAIAASTEIDRDQFDAARDLAAEAARLCDALPPSERRALLGQAIGTHGRALLHAGDFAAAEPLLRESAGHHRAFVPWEEPRSLCYLAICVRLAGRPREALEIADAAIERSRAHERRALTATTRRYLELERGRALAAMGRWREAIAPLVAASEGQSSDRSYPRLGALRSLAQALRASGDRDAAARALDACLAIAEEDGILGRVAAIAAGELILEGATGHPRLADAWRVWNARFPGAASTADIRALLPRWVY